ncbi:MAG: PilT protein [Bryobacterales bacterium]|nr:PilT protein [Bryobacterales bacterium]
MSLIFWDTMVFVYLMEDHPKFAPRVRSLREQMLKRGDRLCTGALTIGETLVGPYETGDLSLVAEYKALFHPPTVEIVDFTSEAADHYARIRADRGISRADALQLACAACAGADLFLTNDHRLHGKVIPGIQFIGGLDVNVL